MEINIVKKGHNVGTIGWLAKGLDDGSLALNEDTLKSNGHHGLWLDGPGLSQFLAAFNQLGLDGNDFVHYAIACDLTDRQTLWTNAAWGVLMDIAQQWCDQCNEAIENEDAVEIKINRVESEVIK